MTIIAIFKANRCGLRIGNKFSPSHCYQLKTFLSISKFKKRFFNKNFYLPVFLLKNVYSINAFSSSNGCMYNRFAEDGKAEWFNESASRKNALRLSRDGQWTEASWKNRWIFVARTFDTTLP